MVLSVEVSAVQPLGLFNELNVLTVVEVIPSTWLIGRRLHSCRTRVD